MLKGLTRAVVVTLPDAAETLFEATCQMQQITFHGNCIGAVLGKYEVSCGQNDCEACSRRFSRLLVRRQKTLRLC